MITAPATVTEANETARLLADLAAEGVVTEPAPAVSDNLAPCDLTACTNCNGWGVIGRMDNSTGRMDSWDCPVCDGTGEVL